MAALEARGTQKTRAKYNRNAKLYDFLEIPVEFLWYRKWRRLLFSKLEYKCILEVGVGTGKNIPYYPIGLRGVGIDLSEAMLRRAKRHAYEETITFLQGDAQSLPFRDNSFDAVVATFVFCSVPKPVIGLQEIGRVLKNDGRLYLLEHVLPENPVLGAIFKAIDPITVALGGVHVNRQTSKNLLRAAFEIIEERNLLSSVFKLFLAYPIGR